jgi:virginiamycin B lyase
MSQGGTDTATPQGGDGGAPPVMAGSGGTTALGGASGEGGGGPTEPITEYPLPISGSQPEDILRGPDDNMWVGLHNGGFLRVTPATAVITEFAPPSPQPGDVNLVIGPMDHLWYQTANTVGHFTTQGAFQVLAGPAPPALPQDIAYGSDGNLWIANVTHVTRMTPGGTLTDFSVPGGDVRGVTAGPDGNLWFVDQRDLIGRMTTAGVVTEFALDDTAANPEQMVVGLDGALWFTEPGSAKLGRITTAGAITKYDLPEGSYPRGLVEHPQGTFWVALGNSSQIARVTIPGGLELFDCSGKPWRISADAAGNIWFTLPFDNKIGKLVPPAD